MDFSWTGLLVPALLPLAVVGVLIWVVYQRNPKSKHGFSDPANWSVWSWQFAFFQTLVVLGVLLYGAASMPWQSVLAFVIFPFHVDIGAINFAFMLCTLLLPLGYAALIQRTIVRPFSETRIPPRRAYSMALKVGVVLVGTIMVIACEIARLHGVHFLFIYLPIFVAFLISSVISVRVAQTRLEKGALP